MNLFTKILSHYEIKKNKCLFIKEAVMENVQEKREALEEMRSYNVKLEKGIVTLAKELKDNPQEDTMKFLETVVNGINWVIQITNLTIDLLNEDKNRITKEEINNEILALNEALKDGDNDKAADLFENQLLAFIRKLNTACDEIL